MAITKVSPGLLDLDSGITITTADNSDNLTLVSTDTDAAIGPNINLYRNAGNGADADNLATVAFAGNDDAGNATDFYRITAQIDDASNGSEDVFVYHRTIVGGTERLRLSLEGDETVINEEGIDLDFRVESNGNSSMLFVDGGNDRVGISTNSPANKLDIVDSTAGFAARITNNQDSSQGLQVRTSDNDTGLYILDLQTSSSSTGTNYASQFVVEKSGKVGIGNDVPIWSGSYGGAVFLKGNNATADRNARLCIVDSTGAQDGDKEIILDNNGDLNIKGGDLIFNTAGKGVVLGATSNTAANTLDDYEEGTFTPHLSDGTNTINGNGKYVKIGQFCFLNIDFYNQAQSQITSTAHLRISNLPFIANHVTQGLLGISTSEQIAAWGELGDNQSTIFLYKTGGDYADFNTLKGNDWTGNMSVRGNFNYRVD